MKGFLIYLILGTSFLTLNAAILHVISPYGILPDFILIMVFYLGFHRRSIEGVITSFFLGLIADTFSSGVVGTTSFGLVFIFAVTRLLSKKMDFNSMPIKIGGAFIMTLLKANLVYLVLRILLFNRDVSFYAFAVPAAIITAIISPVVFNLLDRLENKVNAQRAWVK